MLGARTATTHEVPFECNQLVLVSVRRRGKRMRPARDSLESALEIFEELRAALWVTKTQAELARIGGRASGRK